MYEINVSHNGHHYFATAERSLDCSENHAISMYNHFLKLFPYEEGFEVTLSKKESTSMQIATSKGYALSKYEVYRDVDDDGESFTVLAIERNTGKNRGAVGCYLAGDVFLNEVLEANGNVIYDGIDNRSVHHG